MPEPSLTPDLANQLERIEPSIYSSGLLLYPCSARLVDGTTRECVYLVEASTFHKLFPQPDSVQAFSWIQLDDVAEIFPSPARLPPGCANRIYSSGGHWGWYSFTLVFSWLCRPDYLVNGLVDFLRYPKGRNPGQVRRVVLHYRAVHPTAVPDVFWCLFRR
jgi:hypothetical protein